MRYSVPAVALGAVLRRYLSQSAALVSYWPVATFLAGCALTTTAGPCATDADVPPSGAAFHYLVRTLAPHAGSWGHILVDVCP